MFIDRLAHGNRWQDRHPSEKFFFATGLLILSLVQPPLIIGPLVLFIMGLTTVLGAGIPLTLFARSLLLPAGFILLSTPMLAFSIDINDNLDIYLSQQGLTLALETASRSFSAFSCLLFFSLTTPISDWAPRLIAVGVPRTIIDLLLLIYRFVFLLLHMVATISKAQAARLGYGQFSSSIRSLGYLSAALLPLALNRAMRMEMGLETRTESHSLTVLSKVKNTSPSIFFIILSIVLLVALLSQWIDKWIK